MTSAPSRRRIRAARRASMGPSTVIVMLVRLLGAQEGMGSMMPPVLVSLPFKLLLFVLLDGWHLVVGMLMESFAPFA